MAYSSINRTLFNKIVHYLRVIFTFGRQLKLYILNIMLNIGVLKEIILDAVLYFFNVLV